MDTVMSAVRDRFDAPPSEADGTATGGNVIAVGSGKGGVGKTWLAITLCHALARLQRKVLLFDGDLGLANIDIQLGIVPRHDLASVLAGHRPLHAAAAACDRIGADVIAGRSGSGTLAALAPARLTGIRQSLFRLAGRYDHAVIDIGAGIDRAVQELASGAGTGIVVTTDEPTSLTDAYAFIKVMAMKGAAGPVRIIVNMAASERQGEHTYQTLRRACERFLGISPPLAGVVRRDSHVAEAIRHQIPLLTRHPGCDAARDVESIAARLTVAAASGGQ